MFGALPIFHLVEIINSELSFPAESDVNLSRRTSPRFFSRFSHTHTYEQTPPTTEPVYYSALLVPLIYLGEKSQENEPNGGNWGTRSNMPVIKLCDEWLCVTRYARRRKRIPRRIDLPSGYKQTSRKRILRRNSFYIHKDVFWG